MKCYQMRFRTFLWCIVSLSLTSCAYKVPTTTKQIDSTKIADTNQINPRPPLPNYANRLPKKITTSEKVVLVDPRVHAWGAYTANGELVRAGLATAGSSWCSDIKRACRTKPGSFRIQSLGNANCKSSIYPLPRGGAPMPYCMFFNKNQGLHGSYNVVEGNVSHGCVRLRVHDAEWLRFQFVKMGTKVIVKPY